MDDGRETTKGSTTSALPAFRLGNYFERLRDCSVC